LNVSGPTIRERLAAAWRAADGDHASRAASGRPVAIGWATVELERAAAELAEALGLGSGEEAFRAAPGSVALGCSCRVAPRVLPEDGSLVVLEPDTEGRLAGALARLGEGPAVAWLAPEDPATASDALRAAGFRISAERDGPLGPERLIVGGPVDGWLLLLMNREPGTIRS
jgi:hypothetical protein